MSHHTHTESALRRATRRLAHATTRRADAETAKAVRRAERGQRGARQHWREALYLAELADLEGGAI